MERGYHTFVEKPVALTKEQGMQLVEAVKKTGVKAQVGQCIRVWDEYVYLKTLVDSGKYGKIKTAIFKRVSPKPTWAWENWLHNPSKSGGAAIDLHIHDIDFVRYILGEPDNIETMGHSVDSEIVHIITNYKYSDILVSIEAAWDYAPGFPFEMEYRVNFEEATVYFSSIHGIKVYTQDGTTIVPDIKKSFDGCSKEAGGNVSDLGGYYTELDYFISCIINDNPIKIATIEEGVKRLNLAIKGVKMLK